MSQKPIRKSLSVVDTNDKVTQLRNAFAADGGAGATPGAAANTIEEGIDPLRDKIIAKLREVYDPEIPVNVFDLGLIYGIEIDAEQRVKVTMTLTAPACPVAGDILAAVERKAEEVDEVKSAAVDLVFEPPWTKERMSEAALLELGLI